MQKRERCTLKGLKANQQASGEEFIAGEVMPQPLVLPSQFLLSFPAPVPVCAPAVSSGCRAGNEPTVGQEKVDQKQLQFSSRAV